MKSLRVISLLILGLFMISMVSAVWWNPFTWFGNDGTEVIKGEKWIEIYSDNPDFYTVIPDNSKHDADIYLCSKTATKKADLKDLDFATSFKTGAKELQTKEKLKADYYNGANYCYYYKPTKDEKFLKFDTHSTHLIYTNESISATNDDGVVISELSLITPDYNYKNNIPNVDVGYGNNQLVHIFYLTNYSSESITNLRTINMNTDEEVKRNAKLKYLTYQEVNVPTYEIICNELINNTGCESIINGSEIIQKEKWIDFVGVEGWNYMIGIFADVQKQDYVDIDFDYYGKSVKDSPIDWATWTASLLTDFESFYNFDETSGANVWDNYGGRNATITNISQGTFIGGKIGNALDINGINGEAITTQGMGTNPTFSISSFVYLEDSTGNNPIYWLGTSGSSNLAGAIICESGTWRSLQWANDRDFGVPCAINTWTHVVYTRYSNQTATLFINGTYQASVKHTANLNVNTQAIIGGDPATETRYFKGAIDLLGVWNRALTAEEVTDLYNNEDGLGYGLTTPPETTLISPENTTNFTVSNTVNFIFNVTDDVKVDNITLLINDQIEYTNTSGVNGTYYYSTGLEDGYYNWSVVGVDNESSTTTSDTWFFNVSYQTGIEITLNTPTANQNFTTTEVTFNADVTDNFGVENVSLFIDGSLNNTDTSGVNGTYEWILDFSDGSHVWYLEVYDNDSNGVNSSTRTFTIDTTPFIEFLTPPTYADYVNTSNEYVPMKVNVSTLYFQNITYSLRDVNGTNYTQFYENETYDINFTDMPDAHYHYDVTVCTTTGECNVTETRHINHDNTLPEINITSPTGTIDYLYEDYVLNLNWTVSDLHLDSCWYEYNGINTTLTCGDNTTTFNYSIGEESLVFYANDTFGGMGSETTAWNYKVFEISQTFNSQTTEGSLETFLANIRLGSGYSIEEAVIIYNGVENVGTSSAEGENTTISKEDLLIPGVEADTNFTFYWNLELSDSTQINLSSNNQTVHNLEIDNCSTGTVELFNFTVVNEETQVILSNATIEIAINIYDENREELIINYSNLFEAENPLRICIDSNITGTTVYSLDSIIRYEDLDFANEYYNIVDSEITNETTSENIILYDLNSSDSTDFQLTFNGQDFLPVEGALVFVERQYIAENTFKTVELPKTDSNGQTIIHLVRNDVIYNIRVVKDGEALGNFLNIIAFCQDFTIGSCAINLNALSTSEEIFNYDTALGILYNAPPTYNSSTNDISFDFTSFDGTSKEVLLVVERSDLFGNNSVCSNSITSTSGTVSCDIGYNLTDSTLVSKVYVDGKQWITDSTPTETQAYGSIGYVAWFLMAISLLLMFSKSKNGILFSIALSYIAAIGLGFSIGGIIGVGSAGIWVLVMTLLGIWQVNKGRTT